MKKANDEKDGVLTAQSETQAKTRRTALKSIFSFLGSAKMLSTAGLSAVGLTSAGVTSGCMGETTYDQGELDAYEPFWAYRAEKLEAYQASEFGVGIRSKEEPGPHNPDVHYPEVLEIANGVLKARVNHVMELDHWITTMYVRDIDTGRVFYLKEFHPTEVDAGKEKGATIVAPFPPEVKRFAVFAFCNKHELWWSGIVDLA